MLEKLCLILNQSIIEDYTEINWKHMNQLIQNEQVFTLLYEILKNKLIEPQLLDYYKTLNQLNEKRNIQLKQQILNIRDILKQDIILLKGSTYLFSPLYKNFGERLMNDIDFYVDDFEGSINILKNNGYFLKKNISHHCYDLEYAYGGMINSNELGVIEIHRNISRNNKIIDFNNLENLIQIEKNLYILNDKYQMIYNFLHTQIKEKYHINYNIHLKYLYEGYLLDKITDRQEIINEMEKYHLKQEILTYYYLIDRLFNFKYNKTFEKYYQKVLRKKFNQLSNREKYQLKIMNLFSKINYTTIKKLYCIQWYSYPYGLYLHLKHFFIHKKEIS